MRWSLLNPNQNTVSSVKKAFRTSEVIARVLANRNILNPNLARPFFTPNLDMLHNPYLMQDMDKAVERVLKNIKSGKPIMVFGDYDVDGTTGAAALYLAFQKFGADVTYYIPDREKEGYGLSYHGIEIAKDNGIDLIITCDCGINAFVQVDFANEQNIDIIITDHHTTDTELPKAHAILNPKREDCEYPFKGLCGGGVAFKLITAIGNELNIPLTDYEEIIPLITLGTAADVVPIKDENRVLVHHGLNILENLEKPGLKTLLELAGLKGHISVGQLVFSIAPRINAAGRLGDANRAVELLVTDDQDKARLLAKELDNENKRRQMIQQAVVDEALLKVNAEADLKNENALVLANAGWHPGVVGIVASKIKEEFNRPTIIIALENGSGKGSARSVAGFDLYEALTACKTHLDGYGGHPMAAGLTLSNQKLEDFKKAFIDFANERLTKENLQATLTLDSEMALQDITPRFMEFLDKLSPYGPGNMRPKFAIRNVEIAGAPKVIGKTGEHIRFKIRQGLKSCSAVGFGLSNKYEMLITGQPVDIACVVETNEWQGNTSIQMNVRDIKRAVT
ncbi:MAG TPA: single-stranded-DNA-specific exonuclease RecJ [Candidatus Marinimicrobia bacterium]|nr:single-stranded-DNA-specific exonuclease RecJ [Candidatus Neomarinimicrobiota bacterium]